MISYNNKVCFGCASDDRLFKDTAPFVRGFQAEMKTLLQS